MVETEVADIFISYSHSDRAIVEALSAFLEAQGWTVWWDKRLTSGDEFRDEIMSQLTVARAVIVIWSENSVKSKFVKAEAGAADRAAKLVPTKTASLPHDAIPLPFGEGHTENVSNHTLVHAAILKLLAKPPPPPAVWKKLRYELLSWAGVIGASITLAAHMQGLVKLSFISRYIVQNWTDLLQFTWRHILFFVPNLAKTDAIVLSIFAFTTSTIFWSPAVEARKNVKRWRETVSVALSFSFLVLVFYLGIFLSVATNERSVLYEVTRYVVALLGIDLGVLSRPHQAVLMAGLVAAVLSLGLSAFIAINALSNWRSPPTHEASVTAAGLRLHRIVIGVICLFVLSELAGTIQDWVAAIEHQS
jgi:hypothetical protein